MLRVRLPGRRGRRAARSAGSTSASSASSRPSSESCWSSSRWPASSPTGSGGWARARRSLTTVGARLAADPARLRPARHRHRARLRRRARRACCSSPACAGSHLVVLCVDRGDRTRARRALAAACRRGADVLKPYQKSRLTGFLNPSQDPRGSTYNVTQSITAVGSGGFDGRGVAGATQTNLRLPARARDRLRVRLARRAARLPRRGVPADALPARRLARAEGGRVARETPSRRSSPAGSCSRSCSRSSSTSA